MGADFLYTWVLIPEWTKDNAQEKIAELVDALTEDELKWIEDSYDVLSMHEIEWEGLRPALKTDIHKAWLRVLAPDPRGMRRDVAVIALKHGDAVLSGGMSWGDAPTEAFDDLCFLATCGLNEWITAQKEK
jgi:hypothetical protein